MRSASLFPGIEEDDPLKRGISRQPDPMVIGSDSGGLFEAINRQGIVPGPGGYVYPVGDLGVFGAFGWDGPYFGDELAPPTRFPIGTPLWPALRDDESAGDEIDDETPDPDTFDRYLGSSMTGACNRFKLVRDFSDSAGLKFWVRYRAGVLFTDAALNGPTLTFEYYPVGTKWYTSGTINCGTSHPLTKLYRNEFRFYVTAELAYAGVTAPRLSAELRIAVGSAGFLGYTMMNAVGLIANPDHYVEPPYNP
jgi:hypothetical protein